MPRDSELPVSSSIARSATAPFSGLQPGKQPRGSSTPPSDGGDPDRDVVVVVGDDPILRQGTANLLKRQYESRGYCVQDAGRNSRCKLELASVNLASGTVNGTLSVALDGPEGLMADRTYPTEVMRRRRGGARMAEGTRFAIDTTANPILLLPALFYMAFTWAHRLMGATEMLVEVTPRHAAFYRQMLAFEVIGEARFNSRVGTKGVLLGLDLIQAAESVRLKDGIPRMFARPRASHARARTMTSALFEGSQRF